MLQHLLYIDQTKNKGQGIFARKMIPAETIIEVSPVIVMDKKDRAHLDQTLLHDYIFEWGEERDKCAMALGLVPIYKIGRAHV